jgi:hypothetical protein
VELVFIYLMLYLMAGVAGRNRRIGFWGYHFRSFIFTPFIGLASLYFAAPREA